MEQRLAAEREPSPRRERLDALDKRIAQAKQRLATQTAEREALAAEHRPDRDAVNRIASFRRHSERQLSRLEDERDSLAVEVGIESRRPVGLTGAERAELALIEERLSQLRRREIAAERLQPSKLIEDALGKRPRDPAPAKVAAWNEGVELIRGYRQRYGVTEPACHPLGAKTGDAARRRERQAAAQRLARIQQRLGKERVRRVERGFSITR